MALNIDTQNLELYPGNVKRVTVDQEQVVPYNNEGDETFTLSFSTTAYSNITNRTAISDLYVTNFKAGWCKSSGFAGTKVALDSTNNSLEIKIDATVSGIGGGYYRITLDHDDGIPIGCEVIAADMETKIRALADELDTVDIGYKLAYMNATVEFTGGRFWIISGSLSQYYSGSGRSSVRVRESSVSDCSSLLGFNLEINSESLSGIAVKEALTTTTVSGGYAGTTTLGLDQSVGASLYDCMLITDGTNTEYFQIIGVPTTTSVQLDTTNMSNVYTAGEVKVQLLRGQDPDAEPSLWFSDIDKITRHGLKTIINQIDYSA